MIVRVFELDVMTKRGRWNLRRTFELDGVRITPPSMCEVTVTDAEAAELARALLLFADGSEAGR